MLKYQKTFHENTTRGGGGVTNFDFLKDIPQFAAFADVAVAAEKILMIDPEASVMNCRRAMEFAVKWMYSVDAGNAISGQAGQPAEYGRV